METFVPGFHCVGCRTNPLLPEDQRDSRAPFLCEACLPRELERQKRSQGAKRAVKTKRGRYDEWPCNRKPKDFASLAERIENGDQENY